MTSYWSLGWYKKMQPRKQGCSSESRCFLFVYHEPKGAGGRKVDTEAHGSADKLSPAHWSFTGITSALDRWWEGWPPSHSVLLSFQHFLDTCSFFFQRGCHKRYYRRCICFWLLINQDNISLNHWTVRSISQAATPPVRLIHQYLILANKWCI